MRRMAMMTLAAVLCASAMTGCRSVARDPYRGFENQDRDIREVRGRVADLRAGMSTSEVELVLGEPARRTSDQWIYLPEFRSGEAVPEAVYVQFSDGRFTSWSLEPMPAAEEIRKVGKN